MRKKASLQDIYRLYQVVGRMPKIILILNDMVNMTISNSLASPMTDTIQVCLFVVRRRFFFFKFISLKIVDLINMILHFIFLFLTGS